MQLHWSNQVAPRSGNLQNATAGLQFSPFYVVAITVSMHMGNEVSRVAYRSQSMTVCTVIIAFRNSESHIEKKNVLA